MSHSREKPSARGVKSERLRAVLSGRTPDRAPVSLWRHWPDDDQDPVRLARVTVDFQKRYDWDFVKLSPASNYAVAGWGAESVRGANAVGSRAWTKRVIERPEDWLALRPLGADAGMQGQTLQAIRLVRAELGDEVPVLLTVFNPLAQAKYLAGEETLFEHLARTPEAVMTGLSLIAESTARFLQRAVAEGIDGVFYALQHASHELFRGDRYRHIAFASDLHALAPAESCWFNLLHLHGDNPMLELADDYPVAAVNWHAAEGGSSLGVAARCTRKVLCGGLGVVDPLCSGNPADVQAALRAAIAGVAPERLILSAGCVLQLDTPAENIATVRANFSRRPD